MFASLRNAMKFYLDELHKSKRIMSEHPLKVMSSEDTIRYIIEKKCSISRFGDGEINMLIFKSDIGFQKWNENLKNDLKEVLLHPHHNNLVCLPSCITKAGIKRLRPISARYWHRWIINYYENFYKICMGLKASSDYVYGDALVTRPYIDWKDKNVHAKNVFGMLKGLWTGRDLLIIEGSKTRMGVGNDLFNQAKSIKRILCPATNAYKKKDVILSQIGKHYNGELVLLALGPLATVLANQLSENGIQALDIGHFDIEYEWYKMKAKWKKPIKEKYVNESNRQCTDQECRDSNYLNSIIETI